jgi:DNA polymerase (family 10)
LRYLEETKGVRQAAVAGSYRRCKAAQQRGYAYLAITDHSKRVTVAHGLDEKRLAEQVDKIAQLNETLSGTVVLSSVEVDILDMRQKQTERLLRAMDNRCLAILAHPTGQLIGERDGIDIDLERIFMAARERGVAIEVNGQPDRLDSNEWNCQLAK